MRADDVHSLTVIAVAGRKTMVRSDRLFMAEESRVVSRAICCCMRLYNCRQTYQDIAPAVPTTVIAFEWCAYHLQIHAYSVQHSLPMLHFGACPHLHMFHECRNFSPVVPAIRNGGTEAVDFSKSLGDCRTKTHNEVGDTIRQASMLHDQGTMDRVEIDNVFGNPFLLQIVFHQSGLVLNRPEGESNIAVFVI